ncbi:MAG: kinase-like domain-containing protein [Benniella sp.]|nr:MAG: kinase-like domain-containing protein [Benniella sp.]
MANIINSTDVTERTLLAWGAHGLVFKGKTRSGEEVAIKVTLADALPASYANHPKAAEIDALKAECTPADAAKQRSHHTNEITLLKNLKVANKTSPYIAGYVGESNQEPKELYLKYVRGQSVKALVEQGENGIGGLTDPQRRKVIKDTARGLLFLHTLNYSVGEIVCKDVCHRDMHAGNVMVLWDNSAAQIIDFGAAMINSDDKVKKRDIQHFGEVVHVVFPGMKPDDISNLFTLCNNGADGNVQNVVDHPALAGVQ